jgi:hypothetical protein
MILDRLGGLARNGKANLLLQGGAGHGAAGSNPGSHREGAVGRAIGVFSKENGEHTSHPGRHAPQVGMTSGSR